MFANKKASNEHAVGEFEKGVQLFMVLSISGSSRNDTGGRLNRFCYSNLAILLDLCSIL